MLKDDIENELRLINEAIARRGTDDTWYRDAGWHIGQVKSLINVVQSQRTTLQVPCPVCPVYSALEQPLRDMKRRLESKGFVFPQ